MYMNLKYDLEIEDVAIKNNLKKLTNQIYKLLPNREEGVDWEIPLTTIIEELSGMDRLFFGKQEIFFQLLCKLEGLFELKEEKDFFLFRRIIFECLSLISSLMKQCQED